MYNPRWAHYLSIFGYIALIVFVTWGLAVPAGWRAGVIVVCAIVVVAMMGTPPSHAAMGHDERGTSVEPFTK